MKVVAVGAALLVAASLPVSAQTPSPPRLAGVTTVSGVGSVAVSLQAPAFSLRPGAAAVTLSTTGTAMAFLLVRHGRGGPSFDKGANLSLDLLSARPDGCTDEGSCLSKQGYVASYREGAKPGPPSAGARFLAGRYVAYLVGQPGKRVTATIRADGLTGTSQLRASTPVHGWLARQRAAGSLRVQLDGSGRMRTRAPAGAFQFLWSTDTNTLPDAESQMKLCLDRADEGAVTAPDEACAADPRPEVAGGTSAGTASCNGGQSSFAPEGTGPISCGQLLPMLPPDFYLARWSAAREGWAPVAGYLGLVVEYLRN